SETLLRMVFSVRIPAERRIGAKFANPFLNRLTLPVEVFRDRFAQAGMGDPVRRTCKHGLVASRKLVLALSAGLDPRQPTFDRVVDGLIIADFKMQEWALLDTAPIASVERVGTDQVESASDGQGAIHGEHQKAFVGHSLMQESKEFPVQIGRAPLSSACIHIKSEERIPVL